MCNAATSADAEGAKADLAASGAAATTSALLITACDLQVRFEQHKRYSFALWRLCKMYNSDHALEACMNFLEVEAAELDVGLSLPLQQRVRK